MINRSLSNQRTRFILAVSFRFVFLLLFDAFSVSSVIASSSSFTGDFAAHPDDRVRPAIGFGFTIINYSFHTFPFFGLSWPGLVVY